MFDFTRTIDLTELIPFFALAGGISATLWLFTLAALTIAQTLPEKPDASDWFATVSGRIRDLVTAAPHLDHETASQVDALRASAFRFWAIRKIVPVAMLFQAAMLMSLVCLYPHPFQGLMAFVPATSIFIFGRFVVNLTHRHPALTKSVNSSGSDQPPWYVKLKLNVLTIFPQALIAIGMITTFCYATPWLASLIVGLEIVFGMTYASDALADLV